MRLEMMNANGRDAKREGEAAREGGAHEQSSSQARTLGVGDVVDLSQFRGALAQNLLHQRQDAGDVISRGELRYYPAVVRVHGDLRMQGVREQTAPGDSGRSTCVVERDAGLVAGGLDTEDQHDEPPP